VYPISTNDAPQAIGPYSQGIAAGDFVFVSGQIPIDPKTGVLENSDIATQTKRVLENIRAILKEAGSDLEHVVKVTVFVTDLKNFGPINEIYAEYFKNHKPARSFVEVSALPKGAQIEIEVIALKKGR